MKWQVGDCTKLDFEAGSFDLVIEKSLLDTLVCGENAQDLVTPLVGDPSDTNLVAPSTG